MMGVNIKTTKGKEMFKSNNLTMEVWEDRRDAEKVGQSGFGRKALELIVISSFKF